MCQFLHDIKMTNGREQCLDSEDTEQLYSKHLSV